jgi:hypothetical protein
MHKLVDGIPVEMTKEEMIEFNRSSEEHAENNRKTVYRKRRAAGYPTIGDQLDIIWKVLDTLPALPAEAAEMIAKIKDIKVKYPKP